MTAEGDSPISEEAPDSRQFGWRSVEVSVQGCYLLRGPQRGSGRILLVGFHGYAENAEVQAARMTAIPGTDEDWIGSIQALHPFYRTRTGEVVASWMTKFRREQAIRENRGYVDRVLDALRPTSPDHVPLVLYGFSQGVAMAYRAAMSASHPPAAVISLGGDVPPDVALDELQCLPRVLAGRGTRDRLYSEEAFHKDVLRLESAGVQVTPCPFEGEHDSNEEFAAKAAEFLAQTVEG